MTLIICFLSVLLPLLLLHMSEGVKGMFEASASVRCTTVGHRIVPPQLLSFLFALLYVLKNLESLPHSAPNNDEMAPASKEWEEGILFSFLTRWSASGVIMFMHVPNSSFFWVIPCCSYASITPKSVCDSSFLQTWSQMSEEKKSRLLLFVFPSSSQAHSFVGFQSVPSLPQHSIIKYV